MTVFEEDSSGRQRPRLSSLDTVILLYVAGLIGDEKASCARARRLGYPYAAAPLGSFDVSTAPDFHWLLFVK